MASNLIELLVVYPIVYLIQFIVAFALSLKAISFFYFLQFAVEQELYRRSFEHFYVNSVANNLILFLPFTYYILTKKNNSHSSLKH